MENQEVVLLKVEDKGITSEVSFSKGVYTATKDGEVIFEGDDYEQARWVVTGW